MKHLHSTLLITTMAMAAAACGGPGGPEASTEPAIEEPGAELGEESDEVSRRRRVPELGSAGTRRFTVVGSRADGLSKPRDLAFNPRRTSELWTVNQDNDGTVIYFNPGWDNQRAELRVDSMANHFMEEVSSIAFGTRGTFATCQESRNTYDHHARPNDFMGPTLWSSNLNVYARVNQDDSSGLLGSHLDMLHGSPLCVGIAHHGGNAYWVADGLHGHVVYYDFQVDHGPGYDDHSDGIIRRYPEATFSYVAGVPAHMQVDPDTGWLYVADPGGGRVLRLDTQSGEITAYLRQTHEPLEEYSQVENATVEVFASTGLRRPSGLAVYRGRLFVTDNATGEIIAYDTRGGEITRVRTTARGLMGITIGPDGKIWYVDAENEQVVRVDP